MSRNFTIGKSCCGGELPSMVPIRGYCGELVGVVLQFPCNVPPVYIHKPPTAPPLPPVPFHPPGLAPVPVPAPVPGPMPAFPGPWVPPPTPGYIPHGYNFGSNSNNQ